MANSTKQLIDYVVSKNNNISKNHIYVCGGSMGGTGTLKMLSLYPNFFAGAISCAANPTGMNVKNVATTPLFYVMGLSDKIMGDDVRSKAESFVYDLKVLDDDVKYETVEGWSHEMTCVHSYTQERLNWMFSHPKIKQTYDINDDGFINVGDLTEEISAVMGNFAGIQYDLNADSEVNVGDITILVHAIMNGYESKNTLTERVASNMVFVKGGTFTMGQTTSGLESRAASNEEDNNNPRPDELPLHSVTLVDFEISRFEVTQGLWKEVMGTLEPCWSEEDSLRAMDGVSWDDAMQFIRQLNILTGENYRLPTEAEWEYAARGGQLSKDYRYSGSNDFSEVAWCKEDALSGVQRVGLKKPNELGLYDMSGNAFEWCYDWYGPFSPEAQINPKGPTEDDRYYVYNNSKVSCHVLRGGHWQSSVLGMRVSFRTKIPTTNYKPKCGFRLVKGISYDDMNNYSK